MGSFRFHKRLRLLPGIYLNFSKGFPSLSFGGPGATLNVSTKGLTGTVGLPGSGLSYRERLPWKKKDG